MMNESDVGRGWVGGLGLKEFVVAAVIGGSAGVRGYGAVDRCRAAAAHRQVQQTGTGGQVDVLDVFHLGATHWARLQRHTHQHYSYKIDTTP